MSTKNKKILIVEDELNMQAAIKDNLEYEGYHVICANAGEEGMRMAKEENPDIPIRAYTLIYKKTFAPEIRSIVFTFILYKIRLFHEYIIRHF